MDEQPTPGTAPHSVSILAIVVIYRLQPLASPSLQTLLASAAVLPSTVRLGIVVADNTPGGQAVVALPSGVQYRPYPENPGLARPYNDALAQAETQGYNWLLTLDQDTSLPVTFLGGMADLAAGYDSSAPGLAVAAIVPRILDRGRLVSPFRYVGGWLPRVLPATADGIVGPHTSALNSASLFRVAAMRAVDGYDESFPLHNSDTRLYQRLQAASKQVAVAGSIVVPHELSILDRENRISPARYRQMLEDECAFWDRHMGPLGRAERLLRLALRYGKGLLRHEPSAYQQVTLGELGRRLKTTRRQRLG